MITKKLITTVILAIGLLAGMTSCGKDDDDEGNVKEYDGLYKGQAYAGEIEIGTWEMNIMSGLVAGAFEQGGETAIIQGTVDSKGHLNIGMTFDDGSKVQVTASISNGSVSGTWTNEDGESGTLSGERENPGDNKDPVTKYNGNYSGEAYIVETVIGSWQISVSDGSVSGTFVQGGVTADISGTVNANGALDLSVDFGDGYIVSIYAIISGDNISGTWSNEDGESGKISGTKDSSSNPGSDNFDGNYSGTASLNGEIMGYWYITIENSQVTGTYSQDGETATIGGSVNSEGKLNFQVITLEDEITATVNASINGEKISGTWTNSEGDSGTISGSKV